MTNREFILDDCDSGDWYEEEIKTIQKIVSGKFKKYKKYEDFLDEEYDDYDSVDEFYQKIF